MNDINSDNLQARIESLSPEKKALFELLKQKKNANDFEKTLPFSLITEKDFQILPDGIEDAFPVSSVQLGMLYHMELTKDSIAPADYHNLGTFRFKFKQHYDHNFFQESVNRVVKNQENLRTTFDLISFSEPLQIVHKECTLIVGYKDLRGTSIDVQEKLINEYIYEENHNAVDVKKLPLVRFYVHHLDDDIISLSFTEPHSIADGWSVHLTFIDIFNVYFALLENRQYKFPVLKTSYSDFVREEKKILASEKATKFWMNKLEECVDTQLPAVFHSQDSKSAIDSHREIFEIPIDVVEGLHRIVERLGVPLKAIFLAAHIKMLGVITGQRKVTTGLSFNGRLEVETGDMVRGLFLNTLPVTLDVSNGTWLELIIKAHEAELDIIPYRRYPIGELQNRYGEKSIISTIVGFLHFHSLADTTKDGNLELLQSKDLSKTNYDLTAIFVLDPNNKNKIQFIGDANLEKISKEQYLSYLDFYKKIIKEIATNPDNLHRENSFLAAEEKKKLLTDWSVSIGYQNEQCIHELFEIHANKTPEKIALVYENQTLTYGELNSRANQLAHILIERGVKPDTLVALCIKRSLDMLIGLLGILKAGGAYLPLDPNYPKERLIYMLEDSEAQFLITQTDLLEKLPVDCKHLLCLDDPSTNAAITSNQSCNVLVESIKLFSSNLAYVIYTSGSTGLPKGVMLIHSALVNLTTYQASKFNVSSKSKVLQFASLSFDAATWEIVMALSHGASLHLLSEEQLDSPALLGKFVKQQEITIATLPPALLNSLSQSDWVSVKTLIVAGEACPQHQAKTWSSGRDFFNAYGPTETTICASVFHYLNGELNIGAPIANIECYVLSELGDLVPIGTVGELHIGGAGLARGYLNKPELTKQKFIPNPFSNTPDSYVYKTGDLVRWLPDGNLEYVGRVDDQVKIRGFRIELGEINSCLHKLAQIKDSIVVCNERKDKSLNEKQLIAYVVPGEAISYEALQENSFKKMFISDLVKDLESFLPHYMIPKIFIILESLPLTINGKIDRKALPDPDIDGQIFVDYIAPRTKQEKQLCEIWEKVLERDKVGIDDNFFSLGGHSLLAIRLIALISDQLGQTISIKTIFKYPNIRSLSESLISNPIKNSRCLITPVEDNIDFLPLSFSQQRLWIIDQVDSGSAQYNMPIALDVKGNFDINAAERAIQRIIVRHEPLRTVFFDNLGTPNQIIKEEFDFSLKNYSFIELDDEQKQSKVQDLVREDSLKPFNLTKDLMIRATYILLSDISGVLLFNMHHIASDGWSMGLLINEFVQQYQSIIKGEADQLPKLAIKYSDYAYWQRNWLQGEILTGQLSYWKNQLNGLPNLHSLPLDHPRPKLQNFIGKSHRSNINNSDLNELKNFCLNKGATLFMGLHAAFSALLSRYSNETDIVIGIPVANREQEEIASLIGCFFNNLVLRCDLSKNPSFDELLDQCKNILLNAYAHQQVPFEQIVEELQIERSLSHSPVFQVMLILQNNKMGSLDLPELQLHPMRQDVTTVKYDLTLCIEENATGLDVNWEYNSDIFESATITQLDVHFALLLKAVLTQPNKNIFELPILSAVETHQQLVEWNNTVSTFPKNSYIHTLFENQVTNNPNAIAVIFDNQQLTYRELNQKSNRLAHHLIAHGVKSESLVGLCIERSLDMMVGLMAILKAGAAYVPMDPGYPISRLQHMIEDSQCTTLITQTAVAAFLSDFLPKNTICLDEPLTQDMLAQLSVDNIDTGSLIPDHLAYVIYTSGSTGKPKGVMVEHKNVMNFFTALNQEFGNTQKKNWLALTSISFDISVLELFWTLSNGDKIVLEPDRALPSSSINEIDFSLFYFAAEQLNKETKKYHLLLEGAKFADQNDFAAIWVPERHFHDFGDQFPNPSVAAAAVAALTQNIKIRSGSVVLPLHDPIRVAEEWSMVDNLSNGRVELSIASGWHPNDFVFFPDDYKNRHQIMMEKLTTLNHLWQGNPCKRINGLGQDIDIIVHPKPMQEKLVNWITAAGSSDTFHYAGSIGANVLTHLLGQSIEDLKPKIAIYRKALIDNGFDAAQGKVALMIHTFIGNSMAEVAEKVEVPFKNYLRQSIGLIKPLAEEMGLDADKDLEALIDLGYRRYFNESGLFGTIDSTFSQVQKLKQYDIDEFACLIDFGIDHQSVLESLPLLSNLRVRIKQQQKQDLFLHNKLLDRSVGKSLAKTIVEHQISHIQCTPSFARELVDIVNDKTLGHNIKTLCIGGEAFPQDLASSLIQSNNLAVYNMYGPTETTIWSSISSVNDHNIQLAGPIANTSFYVISHNQLVPVGVAGELYIGGSGVARGYLNRPELTTERFVVNPFLSQNSVSGDERLYRTGDLVRRLTNGNLEFLGRIDHQVKIRGFRIELGEIEQALLSDTRVKEAVVIARIDAKEEYRLIAYVVLEDITQYEPDFIGEALRQTLGQTLPSYMIPAVVVLTVLPLTPNGKIDRKALPDTELLIKKITYVAPQTKNEKILCDIWQDLLGIEKIGIHDNFFALGGHSLQVMQLISRLQQKNLSIAARQLFETPRLIDLAKILDSINENIIPAFQAPNNLILRESDFITPEMLPLIDLTQQDIDTITIKIPGGIKNIQDIYPLAPLQQGILFHHRMSNDYDPYILSSLFDIASDISVDVVLEGLQFIIDRHDVLRTAFLWEGLSEPVQVVCRQATLPVTWLDLGNQQSIRTQMEALFALEKQWIDISAAPLLKVQIALDKTIGRYYVFLQFHHTVSDHVGFEIIQRELAAYKDGLTELLPAPMPYREFVAHTLHLAKNQNTTAFFSNILADVDEPTLPFGLVNVQGDGSQLHRLTTSVPSNTAQKLREIAKSHHISPAAIFHAAWAMVISACSNSNDVVFGTVLSGRLQGTRGVENIMGLFVNTLPIRVKFNNDNAIDLIKRIQLSLIELIPYEHASLAEVQRCSGLKGAAPLFSAILNYRHSEKERSEIEGTSFDANEFRFIAGEERSNYPFTLIVDELGTRFDLNVRVDSSICVERITSYIQMALEQLVICLSSESTKAISELSVLPQSEFNQQLLEWNNTAAVYPKEKCIHELFEENAKKNPHAIAAIFDNQQLTYAELNARANQLAHYLISENQVKPDTVVGICTARSLDMIIAILATLKAGGAYLPLDPEYPKTRLAFMLEDAKVEIVISQSHISDIVLANNVQALCLDNIDVQQKIASYPVNNTNSKILGLHSNNLAYVIYTSGSTGNPKGVMVEHSSLVNYAYSFADYCNDIVGSFVNTNICFDGTGTSFWLPLVFGKYIKLSMSSNAESLNELVDEICNSQEPKLFKITPAHLEILVSSNHHTNTPVRHKIFVGGELFLTQKYKSLPASIRFSDFFNHYGPSETTVGCAFFPIDESQIEKISSIPLGKPLNNTSLFIFNKKGQLCPMGTIGELHIGGVGLARGYLNRPELTAEKFILNPFYDKSNPASSERLYKTGDLVRWLPNGNIEFLGRIDHQVKIRGFRIELGEIENIINSYPSVNDVVVLAKEYAGDKHLVSYVITNAIDLQEESDVSVNSRQTYINNLRQYLSDYLPDYMVPSAFILLDALPLTPNGKVDRKALPDLDIDSTQGIYIPPSTEVEEILVDIWEKLLKLAPRKISITEDFFQIGGHSLLALRLANELREKFKLTFSVKIIFEYRTIEAIATCISNLLENQLIQDDLVFDVNEMDSTELVEI